MASKIPAPEVFKFFRTKYPELYGQYNDRDLALQLAKEHAPGQDPDTWLRDNLNYTVPRMSALDGVVQSFGRGASFGVSDKVAAGVGAALFHDEPGDFGDRYARNLEYNRAQAARYAEDNPTTNMLATAGGAVAAVPLVSAGLGAAGAGAAGLGARVGGAAGAMRASSPLAGTVGVAGDALSAALGTSGRVLGGLAKPAGVTPMIARGLAEEAAHAYGNGQVMSDTGVALAVTLPIVGRIVGAGVQGIKARRAARASQEVTPLTAPPGGGPDMPPGAPPPPGGGPGMTPGGGPDMPPGRIPAHLKDAEQFFAPLPPVRRNLAVGLAELRENFQRSAKSPAQTLGQALSSGALATAATGSLLAGAGAAGGRIALNMSRGLNAFVLDRPLELAQKAVVRSAGTSTPVLNALYRGGKGAAGALDDGAARVAPPVAPRPQAPRELPMDPSPFRAPELPQSTLMEDIAVGGVGRQMEEVARAQAREGSRISRAVNSAARDARRAPAATAAPVPVPEAPAPVPAATARRPVAARPAPQAEAQPQLSELEAQRRATAEQIIAETTAADLARAKRVKELAPQRKINAEARVKAEEKATKHIENLVKRKRFDPADVGTEEYKELKRRLIKQYLDAGEFGYKPLAGEPKPPTKPRRKKA